MKCQSMKDTLDEEWHVSLTMLMTDITNQSWHCPIKFRVCSEFFLIQCARILFFGETKSILQTLI